MSNAKANLIHRFHLLGILVLTVSVIIAVLDFGLTIFVPLSFPDLLIGSAKGIVFITVLYSLVHISTYFKEKKEEENV